MKNLLIIGHSHTAAFARGYDAMQQAGTPPLNVTTLLLRSPEFHHSGARTTHSKSHDASWASGVDPTAVRRAVEAARADAAVLCLNGNEHNVLSLFRSRSMTPDAKLRRVDAMVRDKLEGWFDLLLPMLPRVVAVVPPPPPVTDAELKRVNRRGSRWAQADPEPEGRRLALWHRQCEVIRELSAGAGIPFVELPPDCFDSRGYLPPDLWQTDPTHGNTAYGQRMLAHLATTLLDLPEVPLPRRRGPHPYVGLPDHQYWKQAVSEVPAGAIDPVTETRFTIDPQDRVATAGSCFAQHISKRLRTSGYHFLVTEQPEVDEDDAATRGYYDFSARYGNIYTARQLVQLFDRAFGYFTPVERSWRRSDGTFCDPFRPRIEPAGFPTPKAVRDSSRRHLEAVRRMFEQLDVFVFTLGLTECWVSRIDGAAYPLAPGVAGGAYDPAKHEFVNFTASEVTADLREFLRKLRLVNPRARVILTVSPVPLVATAEDRHVLVSTTYSKAVLRVAAEEIAQSHDFVQYFPSYELITGQHVGNGYYGADRRAVTEQGVDHVMGVFMRHMTEDLRQDPPEGLPHLAEPPTGADEPLTAADERALAEAEALAEAACDEEMLAR